MRISAASKLQKQQQLQPLTGQALALAQFENGSAEADLLLKEFSEVMDKIAAKIKESTQDPRFSNISELAVGAAEILKPEVKASESAARSQPELKEVKEPARNEDNQEESREPNQTGSKELSTQPETAPVAQKPSKQGPVGEKPEIPAAERKIAEVPQKIENSVQTFAEKPVVEASTVATQEQGEQQQSMQQQLPSKPDAPQVQASKPADKSDPEVVTKAADSTDSEGTQKAQPEVQQPAVQEQPIEIPQALEAQGEDVTQPVPPQMSANLDARIKNSLSQAIDAMAGKVQLEAFRRTIERDFMPHVQTSSVINEANSLRSVQDSKAINPANASSNGIGVFAKLSDASARDEAPHAPRAMNHAARHRTMEKVEHALKEAAKSRDGKTISLRLDPPDLGCVKVDVTLRDGNLHARVVAESPAVNDYLREKAHELHTVLRRLGLDVQSVSVSVGNERRFDEQQRSLSNRFSGGGLMPEFLDFGRNTVNSEAVRAVDDHWVA